MFDSCNPMDCSPPGSSVHGIFQARLLEWIAMSLSRWSSWLRDWILYCRQNLYPRAMWVANFGGRARPEGERVETTVTSARGSLLPFSFCIGVLSVSFEVAVNDWKAGAAEMTGVSKSSLSPLTWVLIFITCHLSAIQLGFPLPQHSPVMRRP